MNNYLDWQEIKTVFLDLDGTLLDLHFDNHFWLEYVPVCFADKHEMNHEQANDVLMSHYKDAKGKLDWYCVDFWTDKLGLDIEQLKHEVSHKIAVRPEVREFLQAMKDAGKRIVLVTNAHPASLSLKMKKTGLDMYFDRMINSHDIGLAKEHDGFWASLHETEPFDSSSTLLIDDNLEVLESAEHYGIKYLLAILQPDSQAAEVETLHFHAVHRFADVMPD
ncbi:MAG: GMP/IMP nucleotidase [Gammaproteobacteria bacterium]|nr:GMP/IMP nucleotidase [Gammaproteobacteria bacterium]MCK5262338.1 GMP/IMP nucleotidase [Gammaproteobacteria bacterium]